MNTKRLLAAASACGVLAVSVAACGEDEKSGSGSDNAESSLSGAIKIDGSSTVFPISEAAAEFFQEANPDVKVTVGESGTGGGFEKFCNGETDISNASRPIKDEEIDLCKKGGITQEQVQVANDGIALVVSKENTFAKCLTVDQLKKIWDKDSKVSNWKDVDPSFEDLDLELFGAGTDSGTFDYFTEAINGEEGRSRTDYSATEDDNNTVQGVSGTKGGLGYFGLSYYEQNQDKLNIVQVDSGDGCVTPSTETVQSGEYTPLSRPLFMYPSAEALARPEVKAFVESFVSNSSEIAEAALFVPMSDEQKTEAEAVVAKLGS